MLLRDDVDRTHPHAGDFCDLIGLDNDGAATRRGPGSYCRRLSVQCLSFLSIARGYVNEYLLTLGEHVLGACELGP